MQPHAIVTVLVQTSSTTCIESMNLPTVSAQLKLKNDVWLMTDTLVTLSYKGASGSGTF